MRTEMPLINNGRIRTKSIANTYSFEKYIDDTVLKILIITFFFRVKNKQNSTTRKNIHAHILNKMKRANIDFFGKECNDGSNSLVLEKRKKRNSSTVNNINWLLVLDQLCVREIVWAHIGFRDMLCFHSVCKAMRQSMFDRNTKFLIQKIDRDDAYSHFRKSVVNVYEYFQILCKGVGHHTQNCSAIRLATRIFLNRTINSGPEFYTVNKTHMVRYAIEGGFVSLRDAMRYDLLAAVLKNDTCKAQRIVRGYGVDPSFCDNVCLYVAVEHACYAMCAMLIRANAHAVRTEGVYLLYRLTSKANSFTASRRQNTIDIATLLLESGAWNFDKVMSVVYKNLPRATFHLEDGSFVLNYFNQKVFDEILIPAARTIDISNGHFKCDGERTLKKAIDSCMDKWYLRYTSPVIRINPVPVSTAKKVHSSLKESCVQKAKNAFFKQMNYSCNVCGKIVDF